MVAGSQLLISSHPHKVEPRECHRRRVPKITTLLLSSVWWKGAYIPDIGMSTVTEELETRGCQGIFLPILPILRTTVRYFVDITPIVRSLRCPIPMKHVALFQTQT